MDMKGVAHSLCRTCFSKIERGQYCQLCLKVFPHPLFTSSCASLSTDDESVVSSSNDSASASQDSSLDESCCNEYLDPSFEYLRCSDCKKFVLSFIFLLPLQRVDLMILLQMESQEL